MLGRFDRWLQRREEARVAALQEEFARNGGQLRIRVSIPYFVVYQILAWALPVCGIWCLWIGLVDGEGPAWTILGIVLLSIGTLGVYVIPRMLPFPGLRPAVVIDQHGIHVLAWGWNVPWSAIRSATTWTVAGTHQAGERVVLNVHPEWYQAWAAQQSAWRRGQATMRAREHANASFIALPHVLRVDEPTLARWMNEVHPSRPHGTDPLGMIPE